MIYKPIKKCELMKPKDIEERNKQTAFWKGVIKDTRIDLRAYKDGIHDALIHGEFDHEHTVRLEYKRGYDYGLVLHSILFGGEEE